jgi:hypothetical protein
MFSPSGGGAARVVFGIAGRTVAPQKISAEFYSGEETATRKSWPGGRQGAAMIWSRWN